MNYDDAKAEACDKLLPKRGDTYIEHSRHLLSVLKVTSTIEAGRGRGCFQWVYFSRNDGGGAVALSEWWRRLNLGRLERFELDAYEDQTLDSSVPLALPVKGRPEVLRGTLRSREDTR